MRKFVDVVIREITEAIPPAIYFMFIFHLLALTKAVLLRENGLTFTRSAVATIGALTVAKAILLTDKSRVANLLAKRPLLYDAAWKAVVFSVFTVLFHVIEELIPLLRKFPGFANAWSHLLSDTHWPFFWVMQLWLYGSLLLYCVITAIPERFGVKNVKALLFGEPRA